MKRNELKENGATYTPVDNKGTVIAPITYTTQRIFLCVRQLMR
ncbi:hypothetical protein [Paenibacillus sp. FSL L8-0709]